MGPRALGRPGDPPVATANVPIIGWGTAGVGQGWEAGPTFLVTVPRVMKDRQGYVGGTGSRGQLWTPAAASSCPQLPAAASNCPQLPAAASSCPQLPAAASSCPQLPAAASSCPQLPAAASSCP
eukprot:gene277-biopygen44